MAIDPMAAVVAAPLRRQNMPVIRVGQRQRWDQMRVRGDEAVAGVAVHQFARALEPCAASVWLIPEKRRHPFFVDLRRPFGAVDVHHRQLQQNIPDRCWVEDVGVGSPRRLAVWGSVVCASAVGGLAGRSGVPWSAPQRSGSANLPS
ncbi:hypothetical protein [Acuticoccus kalidii]|uniref:hypothetical protein n=1 Tax=Acuticoccus kalidii TaxID=2910977 RepID=UPI003F6FC918